MSDDTGFTWNEPRPLAPGLRARDFEVFADFHTHTVYSRNHGKGTIEDNILAAREKGLTELAITDHGPAALGIGIRELKVLEVIKARTTHYNRLFADIRVLAGVEANVISVDGRLDVPKRYLKDLDIRVAGLHYQIMPASLADGFDLILNNVALSKFSRRMRRRARLVNTKAIVEAVSRYDLDIVSHPGLHADIDTHELARAAAQTGTALEISAGHPYMTVDFIRIGLKEGVKFSIDSDAHKPANVGRLEPGIRLAERAGVTAADLINGRPVGARRVGAPDDGPEERPEARVALAEELAPEADRTRKNAHARRS